MATEEEISTAFANVGRAFSAVLLAEAHAATALAESQRDQALATAAAYKAGITSILAWLGVHPDLVDAILLEMKGNVTLLAKPKVEQ